MPSKRKKVYKLTSIFQEMAPYVVNANMVRVRVCTLGGEEIENHSHERQGPAEKALASVVRDYQAITAVGGLEAYTGCTAVKIVAGEASEIVRGEGTLASPNGRE